MKKLSIVLAGAALCLLAAAATAGPYASLIRTSTNSAPEGVGLDITYVLNDNTTTLTINIKDSSDVTVASFSGPNTQGKHTVAWDGTNNNAGGTVVPAGTGYYVSITAENAAPAGAVKYAENLSGSGGNGQVFTGFSPNIVLTFQDQLSDNFGVVLAGTSFAPYASGIQFRTDLVTRDETNGLSDRGPIHPSDPGSVENGSIWGLTQDPDNENIIWGVGQDSSFDQQWYRGDVTSGIAGSLFATADNPTTPLGGLFPRNCAIWKNGADKYLLYTRSNAVLGRVKLGATTLDTSDASANILSLTDGAQYSKDVKVDASGNVYWVTRSGGANGPRLYRWDFADVAAAPGVPLTEASATWVVDFPSTVTRAMGVAITNGVVYAATATATAGEGQIYEIAPVSTASLVGTAGEGIGAQLASGVDNPDVSTIYSALGADAFGNLYTFDRGSERIQAWTTGGNTSYTVRAPSSQTFSIVAPPSQVRDWMVH